MRWRRREKNIVADFLVNYTMNMGRSWSETLPWPFPGASVEECNIAVHSDGGTRAESCSAAAWIVEVGYRGNFAAYAMAGTYMSAPVSSFTAEAIALNEASAFVHNLLVLSEGARPKRQR